MQNHPEIVVLGAGESGVGAALLAKAKGLIVFVSDKMLIAEKYKKILQENAILFEEEMHTESIILQAKEIIKSPGIPDKAPIVQKIIAQNIPIISEIEFAFRYTKAKIIAITGSNGKTTTTLLTYHLLKNAGLEVGLGGNIGESFAKQVIDDVYDYFVLEISSFQLDNCYEFKPYIAILLNITPDHLDRYQYDFQNYIQAKLRITQKQTDQEYFIYNKDDQNIINNLGNNQSVKTSITLKDSENKHAQLAEAYYKDCVLHIHPSNTSTSYTINEENLPIKGKHNIFNAMAALSACAILGIEENKIKTALKTFKNAAHRLEEVATIKGVKFINDSKATNVDSVWYALDSFQQPIIWIAGGIDKGNDYQLIEDLVKNKVKALVCLGKDNTKLKAYFSSIIPHIFETQNIQEAVEKAYQYAQPNDIVLLSPACASFDLFENYEDRGEQFKKIVLTKIL